MRIATLALAIVVAASAVAAPASAGWIGDSIRSQKPQCPPKKGKEVKTLIPQKQRTK